MDNVRFLEDTVCSLKDTVRSLRESVDSQKTVIAENAETRSMRDEDQREQNARLEANESVRIGSKSKTLSYPAVSWACAV